MDLKNIIANYHYVENPREDRRGIWPCSVAEFERQIKWLSENYKIVSVDEIFEAAQKDGENKLCAITFDDGLKDQYTNALPILKKYNAPATFFPITGTLDGKYIPATHKIHLLLSHFGINELIDNFNKFFPQNSIPKDGSRLNNKRRLFEDTDTANFKEALLLVPAKLKNDFLATQYFPDEDRAVKDIFLSKGELKELDAEGFSIGCHSHKHDVFSAMDKDAMRMDIRAAKGLLNEILGKFPTTFSYPNGRYNESLIEVLKDEGFNYGFSIEAREIAKGDSPYIIPRFDANDIKKIIL